MCCNVHLHHLGNLYAHYKNYMRERATTIIFFHCEINRTDSELFSSFFPPASVVEGIKSVPSVCPSVCPSVSQRSHGWTFWCTDPKFGGGVDLENISDEFEGHRSKVKVARLKNRIFEYQMGWPVQIQFMMSYDVTAWHNDIMWCHGVTPWHPYTTFGQEYWQVGTSREGRQRSGVFILFENWNILVYSAKTFFYTLAINPPRVDLLGRTPAKIVQFSNRNRCFQSSADYSPRFPL